MQGCVQLAREHGHQAGEDVAFTVQFSRKRFREGAQAAECASEVPRCGASVGWGIFLLKVRHCDREPSKAD